MYDVYSKARHKHIVSVIDFALENDASGGLIHYCLIMELAEQYVQHAHQYTLYIIL